LDHDGVVVSLLRESRTGQKPQRNGAYNKLSHGVSPTLFSKVNMASEAAQCDEILAQSVFRLDKLR
jgi:hypothetical protein